MNVHRKFWKEGPELYQVFIKKSVFLLNVSLGEVQWRQYVTNEAV